MLCISPNEFLFVLLSFINIKHYLSLGVNSFIFVDGYYYYQGKYNFVPLSFPYST